MPNVINKCAHKHMQKQGFGFYAHRIYNCIYVRMYTQALVYNIGTGRNTRQRKAATVCWATTKDEIKSTQQFVETLESFFPATKIVAGPFPGFEAKIFLAKIKFIFGK